MEGRDKLIFIVLVFGCNQQRKTFYTEKRKFMLEVILVLSIQFVSIFVTLF